MGKRSQDRDKDGETRILYKKSNNTILTHSRTCSGASQFYTRSGILQIKKNLSQTNEYYVDGDKIKRDFSIETDVCVLRRHYKSKRKKHSASEGLSAKSKYSTVLDTEVDTIEEFKPDTIASGDNQNIKAHSRQDDLATMMIENLMDLLNNWIQKHLIDNKDTKQKIDTVLDSFLHTLEMNKPDKSSSCSTYVLNKDGPSQVKNKKIETSITCQYCKYKPNRVAKKAKGCVVESKESSFHSVPFPYKNLKIISTLSIPRNFHKHGLPKKKDNTWYKVKKVKHKNILLSFNASSKVLDSSNVDLLAISTKSLTKRLANYDLYPKKKKYNRKRHIVFVPEPCYKHASDSNINVNDKEPKREKTRKMDLDTLPSLVKCMYADELANITSPIKVVDTMTMKDDSTMTEFAISQQIATSITRLCRDISSQKSGHFGVECNTSVKSTDILEEGERSEPLISFDFLNQTLEFPHATTDTTSSCKHNHKITGENMKIVKRLKASGFRRKYVHRRFSPILRYQNIKSRKFTYLYRKASRGGSDFMKYCQNIFQYFSDYEDQRNIRLDIQINVNPILEGESKDECTNINLNETTLKVSPTIIYACQSGISRDKPLDIEETCDKSETQQSECSPEIIPILESAVSQSKYIFTNDSSTKSDINNELVQSERSTITTDLDIVQELSELKAAIKDLAVTAEKYVTEHYRTPTLVNSTASRNVYTSKTFPPMSRKPSPENSKAIQHSSNFSKTQRQSGLKLSKEPKKKDAFEFYSRLTKKSTSYNIIESESILKVTDMTSANEVYHSKAVDQALTCCLPKSRSLFEIAHDGNKRKLIAFFCNNSCKLEDYSCSACRTSKTSSCKKKKKPKTTKFNKKLCHFSRSEISNPSPSCSYLQLKPDESGLYQPSSTVDIEGGCLSQSEVFKYPCRTRPGMGFGEGCVYCLLLWIPVIIISCLFYRYILHEKISPSGNPGNTTKFAVRASDLGF